MNRVCAVLMDTVSIQKYVFASNILKENLGASYIVKTCFDSNIKGTMWEQFSLKVGMEDWKKNPQNIAMQDPGCQFEVGFSGGGKALLFLKNRGMAIDFVKNFTRKLLVDAPGMQVAVAINEDYDVDGNFRYQLSALFTQLNAKRNEFFPVTTLSGYGITALCPRSGFPVDSTYTVAEKQEPVSSVSRMKLAAVDGEERWLEETFALELQAVAEPGFAFSNEIDCLGQMKGDSHIAVVHIDGNRMGEWFEQSNSLADYRRRSACLDEVCLETFKALIEVSKQIMPNLQAKDSGFSIKHKKENGAAILPLHPIIMGGDDICFVSEGRLGIYLAETFIRQWSQIASEKLADFQQDGEAGFSACAGVAIVKTKYPFYRAYQMAEELCSQAKRVAHEDPGTSWLDYYIYQGSTVGNIKEIRQQEFQRQGMQLYFGPYQIATESVFAGDKDINKLKRGMLSFADVKKWPRNKTKELRTAFNLGPGAIQTFLVDAKAQGMDLPSSGSLGYQTDYSRHGFKNQITPYYDMLDMLDYYPSFLLEGGGQLVDD